MKHGLMKPLLILLLVTTISITFSAGSCDSNAQYKKAVQAAYDLDLGIVATQQVVEGLNQGPTPIVGDQDYLYILEAERDLLLINKEFRSHLSDVREITSQNAPAILQLLDQVTVKISNLQAQGVLRIKSDKAKLSFSTGLTLARTSIATLQVFLQNVKAPVTIPPGAFKKG